MPKFSAECQRRLAHHPPQNPTQVAMFEENRQRFMELWDYLNNSYEPSRELSLALTSLQESMMWANAHVACDQAGVPPTGRAWRPSG
jgi:hypothetical protein